MTCATVDEWLKTYTTLLRSLEEPKPEYSFWGGRKFVLPSNEKVTLNELKKRIDNLFKSSACIESAYSSLDPMRIDLKALMTQPEESLKYIANVNNCMLARVLCYQDSEIEKWSKLIKKADIDSDQIFFANKPSFFTCLSLKIRRFLGNLLRDAHQRYTPVNASSFKIDIDKDLSVYAALLNFY